MKDITSELMQAVLIAPDERKQTALMFLQGKIPPSATNPISGPLLLSMGKAAAFLGVGRSTLWRMLQAGRLQRVEIFPGCFRVRRTDLEAIANPQQEIVP